MVALGCKDNYWGVVLDYNNNFLSAMYVVLMLGYVYVFVI